MKKVLTILGWCLPLIIWADGVIIPGPGVPPKTYLELIDHHVEIKVINNICKVEVTETFYNPYEWRVEGEYIFPLPRGAMLSYFALMIGDKKLKGEVLERNEARRIYEDIVRRMRDPALLEYYDSDLFRAKVFPIPPKTERRVIFKYEYELPRVGEFYEIEYPFKIEGISPKPIKDVVIKFDIQTDKPLKQIFSPTHKIDYKKETNHAIGAYEGENVLPDKDFVLYYSVSQQEFDLSLMTYKRRDADGFFLLGISTPSEPPEAEILPKNIVFVLDVSGSMSGEKINQAKQGLKFVLEHLNPGDSFDIVAFASDVIPFSGQLMSVSDVNIDSAKQFVDRLDARGGTNINDALITGLRLLREGKQPKYLIFLTDGLPTVGVTDIGGILRNVEQAVDDIHIFVFGVGYDVNTVLLDKLARYGGVSEYIEPGEDLELVISAFCTKIMYPAVEQPQVEFKGIDVYKLQPRELGDLFYGQDIIIAGRYRGSGEAQVILKGTKMGEEFVVEETYEFPVEAKDCDFIPLIWANKRVAWLLSEIRLHGESKELVDEIIELGEHYGIVTPYTSYLVREEERKQYVLATPPREFIKATSGKPGFAIAKGLGAMEREVVIEEPRTVTIKRVGDKVFYLKDNIYVDRDYKEGMKLVELGFGSPEYFELIRKHPECAKYFAIGESIIVVIEGTAYKVITM